MKASTIQSRTDLANFILALRDNLVSHPQEWENGRLDLFLEALSAVINDRDGYCKNHDLPMDEPPGWQLMAELFSAAKVYE